ncbi:unnamed protein product, partial [Rotaria sp. Silwood1]
MDNSIIDTSIGRIFSINNDNASHITSNEAGHIDLTNGKNHMNDNM